MNEYDSQRILMQLKQNGYQAAASYADADIILLNTCTVRKKAEEKVYSELGRVKKYKLANPRVVVGVGGCLAQQEGQGLLKRFPYVDFVFGTQALPRLLDLLQQAGRGERRSDTAMGAGCTNYLPVAAEKPQQGKISTFLAVMQGCNNYCSYCIVPAVRGREWSRPAEDIVQEARQMVRGGVKEITLLGQNVNSYGRTLEPAVTFPALLEALNNIDGLERLRFITSHPKDLSADLVGAFGRLEKLCEHIHLPLQSGSDMLLKRMNRNYTIGDYLRRIDLIRGAVPDISLTSDIIVGFPGETEAEFKMTQQAIEEIGFDDLFIFHYTDRPGTKASCLSGKIPYPAKIERLKQLNETQRSISLRNNAKLVGRAFPVLFEARSKKSGSVIAGRTRTNRTINCKGTPDLIGQTLSVLVRKSGVHSLSGELSYEGAIVLDKAEQR